MTSKEFSDYSSLRYDQFKRNYTEDLKKAYLQGVKDTIMGISLEIDYKSIKFIDLNLPSGTLWSSTPVCFPNSKDYIMLRKSDTSLLKLPTEEQLKELIEHHKYSKGQIGSLRIDLTGDNVFSKYGNGYNRIWIKSTEDKIGVTSLSVHFKEKDILFENTPSCMFLPFFVVLSKQEHEWLQELPF